MTRESIQLSTAEGLAPGLSAGRLARTRIKICGLTRSEDVAAAVAAGADAVGTVFAPSPRQMNIEKVSELFADVPPGVTRVGVFVDAGPEFVQRAVEEGGLQAVQFHGSETPQACSEASAPVIKTASVGTGFGISVLEPFRGYAAAFLLDTYSADKAGGTSQTFSWQAVGALPGWAPTFVAGGLHPGNVAACIRILRPYAVDVSSGVESSPGIKSAEKIAAFCAAVRAADEESCQ